jgi:hypothetical protein
MKKISCLIILVMLPLLIVLAGAVSITNNYEIPYSRSVWIPCALDGSGEWIYLTGRLHILEHITMDNNGGYHGIIHFQPKDFKGTGLTSGDKYQGTGVTQDFMNIAGNTLPYVYTYVNNFKMIGQGRGNNYLVHETWHITINANGELTAYVDNFSVECK